MNQIALTLPAEDINAILAALSEAPFKVAAGPIARITQQLQALQGAAPAPVEVPAPKGKAA